MLSFWSLLGGSWIFLKGVISRGSRVAVITAHIGGLITPLITTQEPPSRGETFLKLAVSAASQRATKFRLFARQSPARCRICNKAYKLLAFCRIL